MLQEFLEFGDNRVYVMVAMARPGENPELDASRVHRKVVREADDIEYCLDYLSHLTLMDDYHWRYYISVNARNARRAAYRLQEEIVKDLFYEAREVEHFHKYKKLDSIYKSILLKPDMREDKYFLVDYDGEIDYEVVQEIIFEESKILLEKPTPNGMHIVCEPFNYTKYPDIEIKTDDLLYIE